MKIQEALDRMRDGKIVISPDGRPHRWIGDKAEFLVRDEWHQCGFFADTEVLGEWTEAPPPETDWKAECERLKKDVAVKEAIITRLRWAINHHREQRKEVGRASDRFDEDLWHELVQPGGPDWKAVALSLIEAIEDHERSVRSHLGRGCCSHPIHEKLWALVKEKKQ